MRAFLRLLGIAVAAIGLLLAAGTHDGGMVFAGLVFTVFGVALNFWLIAVTDYRIHPTPAAPALPAE